MSDSKNDPWESGELGRSLEHARVAPNDETPAQAFWRGFKRGFTKPWTIITDYWPRRGKSR